MISLNENNRKKEFEGLNLIAVKTLDIFDQYGISTKEIPVRLMFSVIDLDKWKIVDSFYTKKDAIEFITQLTNRVSMHRKITNEQIH